MRVADHPYFADPTPIGLAHRGGALYGPNVGRENTLAAFQQAVGLGYRYLETDVHATRDGRLVALHDEVLDRVTDTKGSIAELSWREVSTARIAGRDPVPLMDELFEAFPQARFNIDVKSAGAITPLVEAIRRHRALDRVCIGSFSDARVRAVRRALGPGVATSAGPLGVASLRLTSGLLSRWLSSPAQALQIPVTHLVGRVRARVVTPRLIHTAHRLGKQVHVWTIDDAAEMHRLLDLGVDGIVSDRIDVLAHVLAQRGHPLPGAGADAR